MQCIAMGVAKREDVEELMALLTGLSGCEPSRRLVSETALDAPDRSKGRVTIRHVTWPHEAWSAEHAGPSLRGKAVAGLAATPRPCSASALAGGDVLASFAAMGFSRAHGSWRDEREACVPVPGLGPGTVPAKPGQGGEKGEGDGRDGGGAAAQRRAGAAGAGGGAGGPARAPARGTAAYVSATGRRKPPRDAADGDGAAAAATVPLVRGGRAGPSPASLSTDALVTVRVSWMYRVRAEGIEGAGGAGAASATAGPATSAAPPAILPPPLPAAPAGPAPFPHALDPLGAEDVASTAPGSLAASAASTPPGSLAAGVAPDGPLQGPPPAPAPLHLPSAWCASHPRLEPVDPSGAVLVEAWTTCDAAEDPARAAAAVGRVGDWLQACVRLRQVPQFPPRGRR